MIVREVILPDGITWKREHVQETSVQKADGKFRLVFEIDRSIFADNPMGTVEVFTSSQEKSRFSLPYLVLRP